MSKQTRKEYEAALADCEAGAKLYRSNDPEYWQTLEQINYLRGKLGLDQLIY